MKRLIPATILVLMAATAAAEQPPERTRWIVGVTGAAMAKGGALDKLLPGAAGEPFRSIDAMPVELTAAEARELARSPLVRYVEPDYERRLLGRRVPVERGAGRSSAGAEESTQVVPWGIDRVAAPRFWSIARGEGIRVGVVDTGVDLDHPDFRRIFASRARLTGRPGRGYDFVNGDGNPADDHGHGTHVAGTIAAADNFIGVIGVAPLAEIYSLKVLRPTADGSATGSVSGIIRAIDWAIEHDLHILNFSLGSEEQSIAEKEAVQRAVDAGILLAAASGNSFAEGTAGIQYPAGYENVIAVGAIDQAETVASFSQRGTGLDLVGPGVAVLSTSPVGVALGARMAVDGAPVVLVEELEGSPMGHITGSFVYCGLGKPEEIPASVAGRIALIKRGELTFADKAKNATNAGASAVVIFNNVQGGEAGFTLVPSENPDFPFPVTVAIRQEDGEALLARPGAILDIEVFSLNWRNLQGTSMATPHVAGVAALVWSLEPAATAQEVANALITGARDLGPEGWDETFGHGVVDAWGAAEVLAPEKVPAP
ncbi:MAG: S8 family serine peptidase [Thermoanaerobaculia bacterium]